MNNPDRRIIYIEELEAKWAKQAVLNTQIARIKVIEITLDAIIFCLLVILAPLFEYWMFVDINQGILTRVLLVANLLIASITLYYFLVKLIRNLFNMIRKSKGCPELGKFSFKNSR